MSRRLARPPRAARRGPPICTCAGLVALLLAALAVVTISPAGAAPGPVPLGTAESFAVLAGAGITNTGPTTITGDVGTFPTTSETGFGSVTLLGTNDAGDAVTQGAKTDLVTAYNDAAGRTPVTNLPVELGGSTLLAGTYTSPTFGLTGTLTLDAQGDPNAAFVFQAGSTLISASASRVLLLNGADPCRVVWQVGSSATFGTGTQFVGDVLASASITAQTAATFEGRLLARDGAVTLDTNVITAAACAAPTPGSTTSTTVATTTDGDTGSDGGTTSDLDATTAAAATDNSEAADASGNASANAIATATGSRQLPETGAPIVQMLVIGVGLLLCGLVGSESRRRATAKRRPNGTRQSSDRAPSAT